jgi:cell division protein ZapE
MTPYERYQRDLQQAEFLHDPAQEEAVRNLQRVYDELLSEPAKPDSGLLARLAGMLRKKEPIPAARGLYLWGGVGRGKTYLVDAFFECLPLERKQRIHFHRFMDAVHHELKSLRDQQNPLQIVAGRFAERYRVICLDELFVSDITDAMILARLLETLLEGGVTFITTSNIPPERLYWDGLQRARFLPAIELIEQHLDVVNVDGQTDYRLQFLEKAEIYHHPLDSAGEAALQNSFDHLAPEPGTRDSTLEVEGREIAVRRMADGVAWFDFQAICDGPRGTADYIEVARCFHSVLVSNVPQLNWELENQARRFLNMVDEFYDRNVKLILSAAVPIEELYTGKKLAFEFRRTFSRLHEMQSHDYLARAHLP